MDKLLEELINHLENTPKEVLKEEFKQLEPYTKIGPSVDEYFSYLRENQRELDPEISKMIDEYFWDLI